MRQEIVGNAASSCPNALLRTSGTCNHLNACIPTWRATTSRWKDIQRSTPLRASTHAITELEFHISPAFSFADPMWASELKATLLRCVGQDQDPQSSARDWPLPWPGRESTHLDNSEPRIGTAGTVRPPAAAPGLRRPRLASFHRGRGPELARSQSVFPVGTQSGPNGRDRTAPSFTNRRGDRLIEFAEEANGACVPAPSGIQYRSTPTNGSTS